MLGLNLRAVTVRLWHEVSFPSKVFSNCSLLIAGSWRLNTSRNWLEFILALIIINYLINHSYLAFRNLSFKFILEPDWIIGLYGLYVVVLAAAELIEVAYAPLNTAFSLIKEDLSSLITETVLSK